MIGCIITITYITLFVKWTKEVVQKFGNGVDFFMHRGIWKVIGKVIIGITCVTALSLMLIVLREKSDKEEIKIKFDIAVTCSIFV